MRVAVSALGPTLRDRVDERFGRAMYLLFVDTEDGAVETVDNAQNRNALQGAGIGAAELVSERRVEAVITGHLGPKAFSALGIAGIAGYNGTGMTVAEAIEALLDGTLPALEEDAGPHTG